MYQSAASEQQASQATGTEGGAHTAGHGDDKGPKEGKGPVDADYEIIDDDKK